MTVRLHGGLDGRPQSAFVRVLVLPVGATLLDAQDALGIPRGEVGLFVVDGEMRDESLPLWDGATVDVYPMFGGG